MRPFETASVRLSPMKRTAPALVHSTPLLVLPFVFALFGLMLGTTKLKAAEVLTQRGGIERTGAYLDTKITQQLVADHGRWGLVGTLPIQGTVYAQPLYVENLRVPGARSGNAVFVASALMARSTWRGRLTMGVGPMALPDNQGRHE
jgi:hypothetical protein